MRLDFDPDRPLAGNIRILQNALVVPWGRGKNVRMARPAGVFSSDGEFCADAMTYRAATRPTTVEPEYPAENEIKGTLNGTVLFGGLAYGHFGHALCESIARLWALDHVAEKIDSVVFLPKKHFTWPNRSLTVVDQILAAMGDIPPIAAINDPTRVERLVIPPQGFGVNDMIGGTPEFRAFTNRRFRERITAEGPEKIYISRSQLFRKRGRFLLEEYIEARLEAEGFSIFHPQQHDLETQLAYYKAAKVIVSTDNSALHLAAFVASSDCRIAILLRRPGNIYLDFQQQLEKFAGVSPTVVDACTRYWFHKDVRVQMNEVISLLDFERTAEALARAGLIAKANWKNPGKSSVTTAVSNFENYAETELVEIFP
jgi:capsular polysaccharide biosynthesis protein